MKSVTSLISHRSLNLVKAAQPLLRRVISSERRKEPAPLVHAVERRDPVASDLHAVLVFFNFNRFVNPVKNFHRAKEHLERLGMTVHVVELVLNDMPFEVSEEGNPRHVRLRTDSEFFQKENLANIGIRNVIRLHPDAKYLALIDADVTFMNSGVAMDTIAELNRNPVVQMWSRAIDLDPDGHPLIFPTPHRNEVVRSFAYCHNNQFELNHAFGGCQWHTGYAWALTRDAWERMEGFYEGTIIGAADYHMAWAWAGKPGFGIHGAAGENYLRDARAWCERASAVVQGRIGCVKGLVMHHWHGRKANRKYVERWSIIVDNGFDPDRDLVRDGDGLLHLTDSNPKLRREISDYLKNRNDDDNTLDTRVLEINRYGYVGP